MHESDHNPPDNRLPPGLADAGIDAAVKSSGYPLQSRIASLLRDRVDVVEEEWGFVDRDTHELRTLDIRTDTWLFTSNDQINVRVRPHLTMLIECKRSELPWLFFRSTVTPSLEDYPRLEGLNHSEIETYTDIELSTTTFSIQNALSLNALSFLQIDVAAITTAVSRLGRKGSELELSGTDAFSTTVLPLVKAADHFAKTHAPKPTYRHFELHAVLLVCVLEAPIILATVGANDVHMQLSPWIRLTRQEPLPGAIGGREVSVLHAIDFVHAGFFSAFVDSHVAPFAKDFAARVYKHPEELAQGRGFIVGLDRDRVQDPEKHLTAVPLRRRASRNARIAGRLVQLPRYLFRD
jgi:hypothetical protein